MFQFPVVVKFVNFDRAVGLKNSGNLLSVCGQCSEGLYAFCGAETSQTFGENIIADVLCESLGSLDLS